MVRDLVYNRLVETSVEMRRLMFNIDSSRDFVGIQTRLQRLAEARRRWTDAMESLLLRRARAGEAVWAFPPPGVFLPMMGMGM